MVRNCHDREKEGCAVVRFTHTHLGGIDEEEVHLLLHEEAEHGEHRDAPVRHLRLAVHLNFLEGRALREARRVEILHGVERARKAVRERLSSSTHCAVRSAHLEMTEAEGSTRQKCVGSAVVRQRPGIATAETHGLRSRPSNTPWSQESSR